MQVRGQVGTVRGLLKEANLVVEVRDARGPGITSATRWLGKITVPRLLVLAKADLADPAVTREWVESAGDDVDVMPLDLSGKSRAGDRMLATLEAQVKRVKTALGIVRAIVVGLPNVGKSTLINRIRRATVARTGDQPGVTRGKMWVQVSERCFVLDTPGIIQVSETLMKRAGEDAWKLSILHVVPEASMEPEDTATGLLEFLRANPGSLKDRRLQQLIATSPGPIDVLVELANADRLVTRGGDPDVITASRRLIARFGRQELGRISLERPGEAAA